MTTEADMIKNVPASGVLTDKTPDLFKRNGTVPHFRGFASFGENADVSVILEVADTPALKAKGMMGRSNILPCCGMLFTGLTGGAFWMKGCKIPLDIVFINDDGIISRIYSMPADNGIKRYAYSDEENAIELKYGFCKRHNIQIGTPCEWRTW